jgi:23S rRNA (adenine2503-C2)-methyltransferase
MPLAENLSDQCLVTGVDFFNFSRTELSRYLSEQLGEKNFRSEQLFSWVYRKKISDFEEMSDISCRLRSELSKKVFFGKATKVECKVSTDGTRKYLLETSEKSLVESVMIAQPRRKTLCVSSQVGCGMACAFCRTGTMGFKKNLTTSEILQQVVEVQKDSSEQWSDEFSNIVFMGMGEPLHNYKNVLEALRVLVDPKGFAFSPRKITVSTVGLVPAIERFANETIVNLAVSLNATTDEVRDAIMPINKRFPLATLIAALRKVPTTKRKQITIEYVLLSGVNDTQEDLKRLPSLVRDLRVKINLIPYNENAGLGFKSPKKEWVAHWRECLVKKGLDTTIRWSKGQDIKAACGQLVTNATK